MIVSDDIFVMLLTEEKFKTLTANEICDANKSTEVLVRLSGESRKAVDGMVPNAAGAGGRSYSDAQDHDFMYSHAFQDLGGHIWAPLYIDQAAAGRS